MAHRLVSHFFLCIYIFDSENTGDDGAGGVDIPDHRTVIIRIALDIKRTHDFSVT